MAMFKKMKLQTIKNCISRQVKGIKSAAALLFLAFTPLIHRKETKLLSRIRNLSNKAINRLTCSGSDLVLDMAIEQFIPDFTHWLNSSDSQRSKYPLQARVDATKTGYHYGYQMPGLARLYDYVKNMYLRTHVLYPLLISIGDKEYVCGYFLKSENSPEGDNEIVKKVFNNFLAKLPPHLRNEFKKQVKVSLDGGWGNGTALKWFFENEMFHTVTKSGGKDIIQELDGIYEGSLKSYEEHLIYIANKNQDWREFDKCHKLGDVKYVCNDVWLKNSHLKIRILLLKFRNYSAKKLGIIMR